MKKTFIPLIFCSCLLVNGQQPVVIDHQYIDLSQLPQNWVDSAKNKLFIGYGHTSHGSQIISGMDALESYFTDGRYAWSREGDNGELHLFEGSGYDPGYLDSDIGYDAWDTKTRTFLTDYPQCNVIIWSWCGQVNDVDLQVHYLDPMEQLENDYPGVKFVYMTGHLEGEGPEGSLFYANQEIRDTCIKKNKILFDFADIEKYEPFGTTNYQAYFADDGCNYDPDGTEPADRSQNWAVNWLAGNAGNELAQIAGHCSSCEHSVSINCVKKGIAAWFLWAKLAGWQGDVAGTDAIKTENSLAVFPNPVNESFTISPPAHGENMVVKISDIQGNLVYSKKFERAGNEIRINGLQIPEGIYVLQVHTGNAVFNTKLVK